MLALRNIRRLRCVAVSWRPSVGVTRILTLGSAGRPNGRLKTVVVKSPARPSPAKHAPPEVEHHD